MPKGYIEISGAPHSGLKGTIEADIYEYGGVDPTTIIGINQTWSVKLNWKIEGPLARLICGTWCLHVHLESIGRGRELSLPDPGQEVLIPLDPCGSGEYAYEFVVPPGKVKALDCSVPYKLVATVTYRTQCGYAGPMAGFVELPIVQFYDPGK